MDSGRKVALADITNVNGKRVSSMDSMSSVGGIKVGKYQDGPKLGVLARNGLDDGKVGDGGEKFTSSSHMGEKDSLAKNNSTDQSMMWNGVIFSMLSSRTDGESVADSSKDESAGRGGLFLSSQLGKAKNSSESPAESEEICSDGEETDSEDPATFPFLSGKDHGSAASSTQAGLDFVSTQESCVISSEGLSNNVTPGGPAFWGNLSQSASYDFVAAGMEDRHNSSSKHSAKDVGSCKCSFCLKAAYMFSDLHYQDARGRLSALKRGKRLARSLEGRLSCDDNASKTIQDTSNRSNVLESDLTQRWRSLFLHSEDVLARETTQLHATLLMLKELRESCKKDLEMISIYPSNK